MWWLSAVTEATEATAIRFIELVPPVMERCGLAFLKPERNRGRSSPKKESCLTGQDLEPFVDRTGPLDPALAL